MIWLLMGLGILGLWALASRKVVIANPAGLLRTLQWVAGTIMALVVVILLARRLFEPALIAVATSLGVALALARWPWWRRIAATRPTGAQSNVETAWLRMSLDHETGAIVGSVLSGTYAGREIQDLELTDLVALLAELRQHDPESAQLVEAYLRRTYPEADLDRGGDGGGDGKMTRAQALAILDLEEGATTGQVIEAHRRLIRRTHPDQGGSTYLSAQVNEARDILLGRRSV